MESFLRDGVDFSGIASSNLGDSHFFEDTDPPIKIKGYLASTKEADKLKGIKHLLALLSQGSDISEFFPDVVKNVSASSVEVKKLVYIYLVHYADFDKTCRELALLSVNSFQKDLAGGNQLIRGLALRVMSSIRVPDLIQIQILAIRKCSADRSPYVRKCACIALTKAYSLDHSQVSELEEILVTLLDDSSTMVLGSAIAAFNEICPTNYDLIHPCYRKLCQLLPDMEEWTQASLLNVMTRYLRTFFTDPSNRLKSSASDSPSPKNFNGVKVMKRRVVKPAFYSDEEDEKSEEEEVVVEDNIHAEVGSVFIGKDADAELGCNVDADHSLLLKTSLTLLKSRNSCVVLAVCTLHHYCGPSTSITNNQIGKALIRILKNSRETQYVVLSSIKSFAEEKPHIFYPYLTDFFIKLSDPVFNRLLKLEVLSLLANSNNHERILKELQSYVRHHNTTFVCAAIRTVGRVGDAAPTCAGDCMEGILHLIYCTQKDKIIDEAVVTLRQLLQKNVDHSPRSVRINVNIIQRLVKMLLSDDDDKTHVLKMPVARASVVWLVGECYSYLEDASPDILRILAAKFPDEAAQTKTQIANFAIKLAARLPNNTVVQGLMTYILEMSRYDVDIDLRDRTRFMTAMMGLCSHSTNKDSADESKQPTEAAALAKLSSHAASVLLAKKLPPVPIRRHSVLEDVPDFEIGSLSSIVGHCANGYVPIPNWSEKETDSKVREPPVSRTASSKYTSSHIGNESTRENENFYDDSDVFGGAGDSSATTKNSARREDQLLSDSSSSPSDSYSSDSSDTSGDSDHSSETGSSTDSSDDMFITTKAKQINKISTLSSVRRIDPTSFSAHSATSSKMSALDDSEESSKKVNLFEHGMDTLSNPQQTVLSEEGSRFGAMSSSGIDFLGDTQSRNDVKHEAMSDADILAKMFESFPSKKPENNNIGKCTQPYDTIYDLSASAKSGIDLSLSPSSNPSNLSMAAVKHDNVTSIPKLVLSHAVSSGLQATFRFRHGVSGNLIPGSCSAYLELRNCNSEGFLRRLRPKFQSDVRVTPIDSIPQLRAGQSIDIPIEIVLRGREGKTIRIDFSSDRGNFPGEVSFEKWELLVPCCISHREFIAAKKTLGGFHENSCQVMCEERDVKGVVKAIMERVNVHLVDEREINEDKYELFFAGCYRKDTIEEKLLLTVCSSASVGDLIVTVNADDTVMSATMIAFLKKSLTS